MYSFRTLDHTSHAEALTAAVTPTQAQVCWVQKICSLSSSIAPATTEDTITTCQTKPTATGTPSAPILTCSASCVCAMTEGLPSAAPNRSARITMRQPLPRPLGCAVTAWIHKWNHNTTQVCYCGCWCCIIWKGAANAMVWNASYAAPQQDTTIALSRGMYFALGRRDTDPENNTHPCSNAVLVSCEGQL